MDEPFDPVEFLIQFPVWFLAHPNEQLANRFIEVNGAAGETATPLFTDQDLAQRFHSQPGLGHYVLALVPDPRELLKVLDLIEQKGFTHVVIDPQAGAGRAMFFPLGNLRTQCADRDGP
jgi:hypothetical protein